MRFEKNIDSNTVLFRVQEIEDAYVSEINLLRGSNMIVVKLESYDNQFGEAEKLLVRFAEGIREAVNKNIKDPISGSNSGFCLGSVIILGNFKEEKARFLFKDGKGADFEIEVDTYTPDESVSLLKRMSGPNSLLDMFKVQHTVLRARERMIANMHAQEWLGWAKLRDEPDAKALQFTLETLRAHPSKAAPSLNITFNTGNALEDGSPTKNLFSDEEAIELWEKVVSSVRFTQG